MSIKVEINFPGDDERYAKEVRYDRFYMDLAKRVAEMSHAKRNRVGTVIVKTDQTLATGWNGMPSGFDNLCERVENVTNPEVIHSEINALAKIARSGGMGALGATMYITLSPCVECAKMIIQSGIIKVIYAEEYRDLSGVNLLLATSISVKKLVA